MKLPFGQHLPEFKAIGTTGVPVSMAILAPPDFVFNSLSRFCTSSFGEKEL